MKKDLLEAWILESLTELNRSASLLEVCKWVWANKEIELRSSGDLFFTWQYDIRWAATRLRKKGQLQAADVSPTGIWELVK